jgi:hypothetical protein
MVLDHEAVYAIQGRRPGFHVEVLGPASTGLSTGGLLLGWNMENQGGDSGKYAG